MYAVLAVGTAPLLPRLARRLLRQLSPPRRLLGGLDEVPRGLAHVSAEQAVEVVYDEGTDHLWRLGLGSGLG